MRLFLALPLPETVAHDLARAADGIEGLRAQKPGTLHLTLRFLGEVEDPAPVVAAAGPAVAACAPFSFGLAGVGAFPGPRRARVVWAGVSDGAEPAARLAAAVEEALRAAGFPPADKPWRAHVTLGRFRRPRPLAIPPGLRDRAWGPVAAEAVVLYRSTLTPQGARHEALESLSLGAGM